MTTEFCAVATKEDAEEIMPWAVVIVEVDGGYMGFTQLADYEIWKNQQ